MEKRSHYKENNFIQFSYCAGAENTKFNKRKILTNGKTHQVKSSQINENAIPTVITAIFEGHDKEILKHILKNKCKKITKTIWEGGGETSDDVGFFNSRCSLIDFN